MEGVFTKFRNLKQRIYKNSVSMALALFHLSSWISVSGSLIKGPYFGSLFL